MKRSLSNPWFFITLCLAVPITAFTTLKWYSRNFERLPVYRQCGNIEITSLHNQDGNLAYEPKGKIKIVNFFFTHCPVICVKMTKNMKVTHDMYLNDTAIAFMSFTVDPARDSVQRLKEYIHKRKIDDNNWQFLTGDKKTIYALARNQFQLVASGGAGNDNDFIHSEKLVLLDGGNRVRGYYTGTNEDEVKQLINDIKRLKHESSNFLAQ